MTKPRKRHTPRPPMLVMRGLVNDRLELRERAAVEAFALGYATREHFDALASMQGVLILAGCTSERRAPAALYARDVLGAAMESIRARHAKTGKLGCNAAELKVLRGFVSRYRDFWIRQPMELYEAACHELQRHWDGIATPVTLVEDRVHMERAGARPAHSVKARNKTPNAALTGAEGVQLESTVMQQEGDDA